MPRLRLVFAVQGDGRGHLTQSLAVQDIARAAGHEVAGFLVGATPTRVLPTFFRAKALAPMREFSALTFHTDKRNRGISMMRTIFGNVRRTRAFLASLRAVRRAVRDWKPDVIVNFYEPLVGFAARLTRPRPRMIAVGHQFLLEHPAFPYPRRRKAGRAALRTYSRFVAPKPTRKLALSFRPMPDVPKKRIHVVPPLLRPEVFQHPLGVREDFILVYLLKSGYAEVIRAWHAAHPDVRLHCFTDRPQDADEVRVDDTLSFHRLSDVKFLDLMSRCRGLVTTAGFESSCEAMWFGKPVMAVPVERHYEQMCNARDAERAGAGIAAKHFDLDRFLAYIPTHPTDPEPFRAWARSAGEVFVEEIERAANPL